MGAKRNRKTYKEAEKRKRQSWRVGSEENQRGDTLR